MKNKTGKRLLLIGGFCILICLVYYSNLEMHQAYQSQIYELEAQTISHIIEEHPELEHEIMETILLEKGDIKKGKELLHKYGLDETNLEIRSSFYHLKKQMLDNNMIFIIFLFLLFSFLLYQYRYQERKKINEITTYLDKVLQGDYSMNIHEYEESDMSVLKNAIYKMTILLREKENYSVQEKKHLESVLSDISHQLKTPLTSMYVINDILSNEKIRAEKKKEMLSKNRTQLERIEWLVSSLLKLSRLDSGMVVMKCSEVSLLEVIHRSLEPLQIPIELKDQKVEIQNQEDVILSIDLNWTVEALVNILKNAHEHTKSGGKITISYEVNPIFVALKIQDNGEGISKEDLPHIFKRFYKGSHNKESIGIGLNMAKAILEKQNAYISVESKKEEGTTFLIKFYKNAL